MASNEHASSSSSSSSTGKQTDANDQSRKGKSKVQDPSSSSSSTGQETDAHNQVVPLWSSSKMQHELQSTFEYIMILLDGIVKKQESSTVVKRLTELQIATEHRSEMIMKRKEEEKKRKDVVEEPESSSSAVFERMFSYQHQRSKRAVEQLQALGHDLENPEMCYYMLLLQFFVRFVQESLQPQDDPQDHNENHPNNLDVEHVQNEDPPQQGGVNNIQQDDGINQDSQAQIDVNEHNYHFPTLAGAEDRLRMEREMGIRTRKKNKIKHWLL
ncbi:hypothetical protein QVD17_31734 [Tagetes erecta]|uniref:Uncharacterized protein n=1 Tax=Tagetes erecta TaxID=13708 RepID=A0AAD8K7L3_TARER|nr:hypothetical protein QVD17_31734 [Tagetes erecta]